MSLITRIFGSEQHDEPDDEQLIESANDALDKASEIDIRIGPETDMDVSVSIGVPDKTTCHVCDEAITPFDSECVVGVYTPMRFVDGDLRAKPFFLCERHGVQYGDLLDNHEAIVDTFNQR